MMVACLNVRITIDELLGDAAPLLAILAGTVANEQQRSKELRIADDPRVNDVERTVVRKLLISFATAPRPAGMVASVVQGCLTNRVQFCHGLMNVFVCIKRN